MICHLIINYKRRIVQERLTYKDFWTRTKEGFARKQGRGVGYYNAYRISFPKINILISISLSHSGR